VHGLGESLAAADCFESGVDDFYVLEEGCDDIHISVALWEDIHGIASVRRVIVIKSLMST
jgi:hypothetical protein